MFPLSSQRQRNHRAAAEVPARASPAENADTGFWGFCLKTYLDAHTDVWPVGAGGVNRRARGSCRQEARPCSEPPPAHPPPGSRIPGGLRAPAATRHGLPTAQEAAEDPSPFGSDGEIATVIRPTDRSGMCFFPHFPVSSFAPNLKTHRCLKAPTKCAPGLFCPPSKGPPQTSRVEQAPSSVADGLRGHVRDQTQRDGPGGAGPRLPPRPLSPIFSHSRLKRPDVVYG